MAKWLALRTSDQKVPSLNPARMQLMAHLTLKAPITTAADDIFFFLFFFFIFQKKQVLTLLASVAQLDAPSDWRPGGRGVNPAEVGNILSWRLIMKYFLWSFSPFR